MREEESESANVENSNISKENLKQIKKEEARRKRQKWKRSAESLLGMFIRLIRISIGIITPIFSAISIWISVIGIAFTLFSGVEPLINVAHWVRFLTIRWREFTHHAWDIVSPYVGFQIPLDLKDFATFLLMIAIALVAGIFSTGRRLVVNEAIVGIRMAIYGISHAIGPARQADTEMDIASRTLLLFFEINTFLSKYLRSFFTYSLPSLILVNVSFRVAIVFIPMIILVPEAAFQEHLGFRASRVEYIVISAVLSYSAAIFVLTFGAAHLIIHYFRAIAVFLALICRPRRNGAPTGLLCYLKSAFADADFGVTYVSTDRLREIWGKQPFLARLSASMIRPNWVIMPISKAEKFHRKYDPYLSLSERRYADAAFIDRITKGLFLFFIIYALNWVSVNSENILDMFSPPNMVP